MKITKRAETTCKQWKTDGSENNAKSFIKSTVKARIQHTIRTFQIKRCEFLCTDETTPNV